MRPTLILAVTTALASFVSVAHAQARAYPVPYLTSTSVDAARFVTTGSIAIVTQPQGLTKHCTATLIAGADAPPGDARALVVTAGHCALVDEQGRTIVDARYTGSFTPGNFMDTRTLHRAIPISRVLYATWRNGDLGLVELDATYAQLLERGLTPARLDTAPVTPGTRLENPQAPVRGGEQWLRLGRCAAGTTQPMAFDGDAAFAPAVTWSDCPAASGASGSPIVRAEGRDVAGILTTGFFEYPELGLPAEQSSWFEPVGRIARAIRADSSVDLSVLDPGDGIVLTERYDTLPDGQPLVGLSVRDPLVYTQVRFKAGPATTTDCADPAGYGEPEVVDDAHVSSFPVPAEARVEIVCAVGFNVETSRWQSFAHATIHAIRGLALF